MRELARGECVRPLEFRGADFWQEIANEFNAVRDRVQASAAAAPAEHEEEKEPAAVCGLAAHVPCPSEIPSIIRPKRQTAN